MLEKKQKIGMTEEDKKEEFGAWCMFCYKH